MFDLGMAAEKVGRLTEFGRLPCPTIGEVRLCGVGTIGGVTEIKASSVGEGS